MFFGILWSFARCLFEQPKPYSPRYPVAGWDSGILLKTPHRFNQEVKAYFNRSGGAPKSYVYSNLDFAEFWGFGPPNLQTSKLLTRISSVKNLEESSIHGQLNLSSFFLPRNSYKHQTPGSPGRSTPTGKHPSTKHLSGCQDWRPAINDWSIVPRNVSGPVALRVLPQIVRKWELLFVWKDVENNWQQLDCWP